MDFKWRCLEYVLILEDKYFFYDLVNKSKILRKGKLLPFEVIEKKGMVNNTLQFIVSKTF